MAIQTKNFTLFLLLIAIVPRFICLSKADNRLMSEAAIAVMKIIDYFKKNYQSLTFVSHFGVRVVEGQLKLLLLEYEQGHHRSIPAKIMTELRHLSGEATKVANMAIPHLLDQDANQFNKLHHQIKNPWLMFHPHRLIDHDSHRYPVNKKPSKNLIEESNHMECILELTGSKSNQHKCQVKEPCLQLMTSTEYNGYNLQHQIFYSAFAEKIGCSDPINEYLKKHSDISSLEELQKMLCSMSYYELQRITSLYGIPPSYRELFLLTQFTCPNLGFFEFLHENWLQLILSWQKPSGCFPLDDQGSASNHSIYIASSANLHEVKEMKGFNNNGSIFHAPNFNTDLNNEQKLTQLQNKNYSEILFSKNNMKEKYKDNLHEIYVGKFPPDQNENFINNNGVDQVNNVDLRLLPSGHHRFNLEENNADNDASNQRNVMASNGQILFVHNQNQFPNAEHTLDNDGLINKYQERVQNSIDQQVYSNKNVQLRQNIPFAYKNVPQNYNSLLNSNNVHPNVYSHLQDYSQYHGMNPQPFNKQFDHNKHLDQVENSPNIFPYMLKFPDNNNYLQNKRNNFFPGNAQIGNKYLADHKHYQVKKPLEINYYPNIPIDGSNHRFFQTDGVNSNIQEIVHQNPNTFYEHNSHQEDSPKDNEPLNDSNLLVNSFKEKENNEMKARLDNIYYPSKTKRELPDLKWHPEHQPNVVQHWRGLLQAREAAHNSDEDGYFFDRDQHIGRVAEQNNTEKKNVYLYYYPLFEQMKRMNENRQLRNERKTANKKPPASRKLLKQKTEECHPQITGLAASALTMYIRYLIDPGPNEFHHLKLSKTEGEDVNIVEHNDDKELFHGEDEEPLPPYKIGEVGNVPYPIVQPANVQSYEANNKPFEPLFVGDVRKKLHPEESEDYVRKADTQKELNDKIFLPSITERSNKKNLMERSNLTSLHKTFLQSKNDNLASPKAEKLNSIDFPDVEYTNENSSPQSFVINTHLLSLQRHFQTELGYPYFVIILISFICILILYKYLRYKRYLLRHRTKRV